MKNIEKFQEFEENHKLFDFSVKGFTCWAYLRFTVYMKIEEVINNQHKRTVPQSKPSFKQILDIIKNCTINNPLLSQKKCDCLFITHARRTMIDGRYECLYTDALSDIIPNSISTEYLYHNTHLEPAKTKSLLKLDFIDILPAFIKPILNNIYSKELLEVDEFCNNVAKEISDTFHINYNGNQIASIAKKRFVWYVAKKKLTDMLVQHFKPKAIVEVVGYDTNKMIINEVASKYNIPTIELQHGVIGRGHIAYNYKSKHDYKFLPKYLFLFSDYWKETSNHPLYDNNLISVGYPYLDRLIQKYPKVSLNNTYKIRVIILSQPEFSLKLMEQAFKLIENLHKNEIDFEVYYKLHPSEYLLDNSVFDKFAKFSGIHIIKDSSVNLYELFAKVDIQIGVTSTAIFEGLAYNLKTFIFHFEKTDTYMGDIVNRGLAEMCEDYNDMADKIIELSTHPLKGNIDARSYLFKPEALQNAHKALTDIIKKSKLQ